MWPKASPVVFAARQQLPKPVDILIPAAATGYRHRAAARYTSSILALQVLAPRPSAHRGNPTSAKADHVHAG